MKAKKFSAAFCSLFCNRKHLDACLREALLKNPEIFGNKQTTAQK